MILPSIILPSLPFSAVFAFSAVKSGRPSLVTAPLPCTTITQNPRSLRELFGFEILHSEFVMILSIFPPQVLRILPSSVSISVYPWLNSFGCGSAALCSSVVNLELEILQSPQSDLERDPADEAGEDREANDTGEYPDLIRVQAGGAKPKQEDGHQNIKKAQDKAECAAKSTDDFGRVNLFEVGVEHAKADRQAVQGEGHDGDDGRKKRDAVPRHFEEISGQGNQAERDDE
jgi:hypothetical protein